MSVDSMVFETYEHRKRRLSGASPKARQPTLTIPAHCHPFARILFEAMRREAITYDELAERSGVLRSTCKAWRVKNAPGLALLAACLDVVGMTFVACPKLERLDHDLRADLEALAAKHSAKVEHLAAHLIETKALTATISEDGCARVARWRARADDEAESRHVALAARDARIAAAQEMEAA